MSSYRGEAGAWDGGPPGAEADYAPPPAPPAPRAPTTDPWTGVSYSQYPPQYDYQGYGSYGYGYDPAYYQRPDAGYYEGAAGAAAYPPAPPEPYDYARQAEGSRSPHTSRNYEQRRSSYRSKSRSVSPYDRRQREYSKKRDTSYEDSRWRRSRSGSKRKYSKYTSSDRSSYKSRSYSRSPKKIKKERRSSSRSSRSERSYNKPVTSRTNRSLTPPLKSGSSHTRNRSNNEDRVRSPPVKYKLEKETKSKGKSDLYYDSKSRDRRERENVDITPPRKNIPDSPKNRKRSDNSITPPIVYKRSERSPQRKKNYKDRKTGTPPRKPRDSSITPPRCYTRNRSSSRSLTPKIKHKRSRSPKSRRKRSSSSSVTSASSVSSQSEDQGKRKSASKYEKNESRSKSRSKSKGRVQSKERSSSRRRSPSRFKARRSRSPKKSNSRSRSRSCPSRSGTPSDEECRGQFTVADRKRFWKMHKSRQVKAEMTKTPPKEVEPPPGAVETSNAAGIEYGDPPEVVGPNYAELLQQPEQIIHAPSSSKSKPVAMPIKNDGSFLEMFKKMQEQTKKVEEVVAKPLIKKPVLPFIGKRRGGRVLKTGLVKKAKAIDEQTVDNTPKDAWSLYMQEVKKYRETSCEEERKTRPLVK